LSCRHRLALRQHLGLARVNRHRHAQLQREQQRLGEQLRHEHALPIGVTDRQRLRDSEPQRDRVDGRHRVAEQLRQQHWLQ